MIAHCPQSRCIHHNLNGCKADVIYHSTDGFCVSYRRKVEVEYRQMMQYGKPIDYRMCDKDR